MFGRRAREGAHSQPREPFTYIHEGTVLTGDITAEGRVRVHGTVRGNVTVNGALEVAASGRVEATNVNADEVKVLGRLEVGRLVARGKVEIWKGGEVIGDVTAAALDIEDGARFTGRSDMTGQQPAGGQPPAGGPEPTAAEDGLPDGGAAPEGASGSDGGA